MIRASIDPTICNLLRHILFLERGKLSDLLAGDDHEQAHNKEEKLQKCIGNSSNADFYEIKVERNAYFEKAVSKARWSRNTYR